MPNFLTENVTVNIDQLYGFQILKDFNLDLTEILLFG